jgi:DNA invertase Pin-like site-specific DNA recombinase
MNHYANDLIRQLLAKHKPVTGSGRLIGYARVSTDEQKMDLQMDALKRAGVDLENIYVETVSGAARFRPQRERCLRGLRQGDTLVVWKLDRLGRKIIEVLMILEALDKRGVGFKSVTEAIDTATAPGRLMMHMIVAFAEFERGMIAERTRAGLRAKVERGGRVGMVPRVENIEEKCVALFKQGRTVAEAARELGYTRQNVARFFKAADAKAYWPKPKPGTRRK